MNEIYEQTYGYGAGVRVRLLKETEYNVYLKSLGNGLEYTVSKASFAKYYKKVEDVQKTDQVSESSTGNG